MSHNTDHTYSVVSFLLGTNSYRQGHTEAFCAAAREIGPDRTYQICNAAQLVGPFMEFGAPALEDEFLIPSLRYEHIFQKAIQRHLESQLREIINECVKNAVRPILLKGTSLWYTAYKKPEFRRVRDMDIQLLSKGELDKFCQILDRLGYRSDNEEQEGPQYEIGEYKRVVAVTLTEEEKQAVHNHRCIRYFPTIYQVGQSDQYMLEVIVEPHMAPFVYHDGSFPEVKDDLLEPHRIFEGTYIYKGFAQLPYLATKIVQDFEELQAGNLVKKKAFKLVRDFVSILCHTDETLSQSVGLANRWRSAGHYFQALVMSRELVPEIDFLLPGDPPDNTILRSACKLL